MSISLLVAADDKGCIGKNGKLPWSEDSPAAKANLRWFREITLGHVLIMGRKTFESVGPLNNRYIFVLTKNITPELKKLEKVEPPFWTGVEYITNPEHPTAAMHYAITRAKVVTQGKIFVCGGAEIYKLALPFADEIILTKVPGEYEGDTLFPVWPLEKEGFVPDLKYKMLGLDNAPEIWYYRKHENKTEV